MSRKKTESKAPLLKTFKLTFKMFQLWQKEFPGMFVPQIFSQLVGTVSSYINVYISARLLDEIVIGRDWNRLWFWVLMILSVNVLTNILFAIILAFQNYQLWPYQYKWKKFYSDKLFGIDFASIDDPKNQELMEKINQGEFHNGWGVSRAISLTSAFFGGIFGIAGAITLSVSLFTSRVPESAGGFTILNNPIFIVLVVAVILGVTFLSSWFSVKSSAYDEKIVSFSGFSNRLFGFFMGFADKGSRALDIRIYNQDKFVEGFAKREDLAFSPKGIAAKYAKGGQGIFAAFSSAASGFFTGIVYLFVCVKSWTGAFGVGYITQYISAITRLSTNIGTFLSTLGELRTNAVFLERTFTLLEMPSVMQKGDVHISGEKYEIEFRNVSFKYPGADIYALKNINLKFKVGEKMAVVGENGSGKTTFIKLLCRLYDPTEGEILLNGKDIKEYDYKEYMSIFSVIFQDFTLLPFSLAQNVSASESYDEEKVVDCLNKAGFADRLSTLPDGINTVIYKDFKKNGVDVSGGEAQKIAIARALYKNSPFIILDEPTAALDPLAEFEIYSKFNEMVGRKTAIFISHRLSSCRFCDDIAVFDDGRLIQRGSHKTLIAEGGKYGELWNAQAQYYA